ncbi:MAG: hypothetical protein FJW83_09890 [Actinobacteria bacterium]|nr:hypothetical protein [Actinomycetota bacterium]
MSNIRRGAGEDGSIVERFADLVGRPAADVPLDEAAALLGAMPRRVCDVAGALAALDVLGVRVVRGGGDLDALRHVLFVEDGFDGDRRTYGAVENSFLDAVLAQRRGLPITLAVIAIEVGRRAGVPLVGIGMPGHFLVRAAAPDGPYLDVFDGGRLLDRAGCEAVHARVRPGHALPAGGLEPVDAHAVLARMLMNLTAAGRRAVDPALGLRVARLRCALPDAGPAEQLALGSALGVAGRFLEAAELFERLAAGAAEPVARELGARAVALRARLN